MASVFLLVKSVDKMFDTNHAVLYEDGDEIETKSQALVCLVLPIIRGYLPQLRAFSGSDRFKRVSGSIVGAGLHLADDERPLVLGYQIYLAKRTSEVRDDDLVAFSSEEIGRRLFPDIAKARVSLSQAE